MIYTITSIVTEIGDSEKISIKGPLHIKVPNRDIEDQPLLGFSSKELGEAFMGFRNYSSEEYSVVPLKTLLNENNKNKSVLVYENEQQFIDVQKNSEEYDYESLIHQNAL